MSHDPDISYIGVTKINLLDNGGSHFGTTHGYGVNTHADIQEIGIPPFNGSNAGIVFACTDGGLWRSTNFGATWAAINNDLNINQFYCVGASQLDNSVLGGSQDNYNIRKRNNGTWHALGSVGDGALASPINPNDPELYAWADVQNYTLVIYLERNSSNVVTQTSFATTPHGDKHFTYLHTEPNTILTASDRMYRRANGTSTVGNPFPGPVLNPITDNKATYFDYCFSQPNIIYLAAGGRWKDTQGGDNWNDVNGFTEYNFFKSTDGGMNWTALQTNLSGVIGNITSIAVHPYNSNKIWITFGGFQKRNDYGNQNVFMSTNGGVTWTNYSTGLPLGSTKDIIYRQGSNDMLYVAMDRGVYYRDAGMSSWECFDTDLPSTHITDLDINYCNGKLYASTFGRGIWATNILQDPYPANNPPAFTDEYRPIPGEIITTTPPQPWTGRKIIYSGITVKNGTTLTIGNGGTTPTTVYMPKNGVILVEKGGTLIVDGATITNSCDECMWAGISVQGTNYAPQTLQYQGKLILKNNAVLEHAHNAVGNSFIDDPNRYGNTGGIIQATNTTFKNNARSAEFLAHYDMQTFNDQSYFRNCTFKVDNGYKGIHVNYPFKHHVTLWESHGVEFNGCTFENNLTSAWKNQGDGIYGYNADFDVRPYPLGTNQPSNTFKFLKHGIVADGDIYGFTHSAIIDRNSFNGNSVGIKIINIPHVSAIRNTFTIGNGSGGIEEESCKDNISIYTKNTPQFRVEENIFNGVTGSSKKADKTIGTLVDNSGKNDKELYKNSYTSLDMGTLAKGMNGSYIAKKPSGQTGLRLICNTFTTNARDINVTGDPQKFEGIAYSQGYYMLVGGTWKMVSAGNRFMTSTATHIHNTASNFNYFHYNSVTLPTNIVGPVTVITADAANACASRLSSSTNPDRPVELTVNMKTDMKNLFYTSKTKRDNRQNVWQGLMNDGRPEQEVLDQISGMSGIGAMNLLLSYSPYVSGGVIKGTASMGVMNKSMLKEVLVANPDVIRDMDVMTYLSSSESASPLDEDDREELYGLMQTVTARTLLEAEISFHQANMSHAVNMLLTDIKSKEEVTEADSIVVWLNRTGELWAQYQRAYYLFDTGNYQGAQSVLTSFIPGNYTLSEYESSENGALQNIITILKNRKENGRHFETLNNSERNALLDIEAMGLPNSSSLASSILAKWGAAAVTCIEAYYPGTESRMADQKNPADKTSLLSVYPNPADEYMVFEYQLQDDKDPIHVTVSNALGQQVGSFELKAKATGKHYWDIRHLPPGNYFYKANSVKKDYGSGKIVVAK